MEKFANGDLTVNVKAENSDDEIGKLFNGFNKAVIGCKAVIGRGNEFIGTASSFSPFKELENIYVGDRSLILKNNIIDLSDTINIGNDVVVGGLLDVDCSVAQYLV